MRRSLLVAVIGALLWAGTSVAASACEGIACQDPRPDIGLQSGAIQVTALSGVPGAAFRVAGTSPLPERSYSLVTPCQFTDPRQGSCEPGEFVCEQIADRIVVYYFVVSERIVQPDRRPIDGVPPAAIDPVGSTYGPSVNEGGSCVDVTDLNPPPSPEEVFRYFQTLPLPEVATRQQPPGEALVGLPVIFFTDSPTTQTFTVDIRGFTVVIAATATSYTWDTGDGTVLTTTDPGAPYPAQTITHDYASGTYTASLTTTWGATFTVDGGLAADVPGTTTTEGAPVTFTVRQARTVLTNPYD
jgi:hypothetical protein